MPVRRNTGSNTEDYARDVTVKSVKHWISPAIRSMQAYHVPPATGMLKLDAMENPYGWPADLRQQWLRELQDVPINRYPDPGAEGLKEKIRSVMEVPDAVSIMLGNGSDELIQIIALALARPERTFLAPEPGFVMYRLISQTMNTGYYGVPLNPGDFSLDRETILAAVKQHQPALIFIAYPNNPTGNLFDQELILDVIREAPGLVVIDEAYHAFARASFIGQLEQFDNLLVMRTLSKSGLAGLRLGYLLGRSEWLNELEKIRLPYNINSLTQKTAGFILSHYQVLVDQARQICVNREELFRELNRIKGIEAWPSAANFILFRVRDTDAQRVYTDLKARGVLIKLLHGQHALLHNCLRVTVGTPEENSVFIETLQQVLNSY